MNQEEIIKAIIKERIRQDKLHPDNEKDEYLAILVEEVGEIAAALQGQGNLKEEIVQLAAVCFRWLEAYA
jgi:NTP pyrophosphatase (non-canonical NTP hydrolase)